MDHSGIKANEEFKGSAYGGFVMNVLTDMYNNRLEDEITKLIRKKEKIREYEAVSFKLERSKDWRGHFV